MTRGTICFDLDGVICGTTDGNYAESYSHRPVVDTINLLRAEGYKVIIFTARGTTTGIDWRKLTEFQLEEWGVEYDELRFGKPEALVYVDDRALRTTFADLLLRSNSGEPHLLFEIKRCVKEGDDG